MAVFGAFKEYSVEITNNSDFLEDNDGYSSVFTD